jgi:outer membrane lipoprotein-sorting protein
MRRGCFKVCLLVGCFLPAAFAATAQEVVHALWGTVRSINSTAKTITVATDDGSEGLFQDFTKSNISLDFDKKIRAEATTANAFTKNGVRVIVYYFGNSDERTAVALQDLGSGPFEKSSGTVIKFHRNEHTLTLKNKSGTEETFRLSPKSVAETAMGAVESYDLDLEVGDQVRVTAAPVRGVETALFVRVM